MKVSNKYNEVEDFVPIIAVTMGDPVGIGPEVIVKSLFNKRKERDHTIVVIGDVALMNSTSSKLSLPLRFKEIRDLSELKALKKEEHACLMPYSLNLRRLPFHQPRPDAGCGQASGTYIKRAVELTLLGVVHGVVTAPINKKSIELAGFRYPGHTELLADLTKSKECAMMMIGDILKIVLVTTHLPLRRVSRWIDKSKVLKKIQLAAKAMKVIYDIKNPRIAVSGLNPHAGEEGRLGSEEGRHIIPAVKRAISEGMDVSGPLPPDILFRQYLDGLYDVAVCMYHDQALIPFKMLHFEKGINITLGIPIIRTSPDHGTAFDIAGEGKANPSSMMAAIDMALHLTRSRVKI